MTEKNNAKGGSAEESGLPKGLKRSGTGREGAHRLGLEKSKN